MLNEIMLSEVLYGNPRRSRLEGRRVFESLRKWQGLKPVAFWGWFIGPAEAVPLLQGFCFVI